MTEKKFFVPESLHNFYANGYPVGFQFQITLAGYRNKPLSCIEKFVVKVDDVEIPANMIHFCLGFKKYLPHEISDAYTDYWAPQDPATVEIDQLGGLPFGEHKIEVYMLAKSAYIGSPFYVTDVKNQPHTYNVSNMGKAEMMWVMS